MDYMVDKLRLNNIAVSYIDSTMHSDSLKYKTIRFYIRKLQADISEEQKGLAFQVNGPVAFEQLTFNPAKGSYLKDTEANLKLNLFYNKEEKNLHINNSGVTINKQNKQNYTLAGNLLMGKLPVLSLTFQTEAVMLTDVLPLLTANIASKLKRFKISQPVKASAKVQTPLMKGYIPEVEVLFATSKATVTYKDQTFKDVSLNGKFASVPDSTRREVNKEYIEVKDFFGRYEQLPIQANYLITNLKDPDIDLKSTINLPLKEANHFLNSAKMTFDKGTAQVNLQYKGKLQNVLDKSNKKMPGTLKGNAVLKDASFQYMPRQFEFTRINGSVQFNQSHAIIDSLRFLVNNNTVKITGQINDLVPFTLYDHDKIRAELKMTSPSFDFGNFKSPGTLRQLGLLKEKNGQQTGAAMKLEIARKIEEIIDNIECHLTFNINEVKYKQFMANYIQGNITLEENSLGLENISLNNSDGVLKLNGAIRNISQPRGELAIQATIQDADVRKLFYSFENFKQKTLEEKNLMGELHADISFSSAFDDSYNLFPESMQGNFEVQLTNGRLIDFEPLSKVGKVVFKQRDFTNIEFADIRNSFELKGQDLYISRMQIASSVLNLFIEGIFSFNKETDLVIQLPLSNLSLKEDKEIIPETMGVNQDAGTSVYLRAKASTGQEKVKITYDPFKKGLKELRKEEDSPTQKTRKKKSSKQRPQPEG
jgi:hypothetical protein